MSINREILRLSLPSILASITIPLVGVVDTAIVGHIADTAAIGGIAIASMLFDLLYWNFGFLRVGTGGLTAQAFGRKATNDIADIFTRSSVIALGGALLIWLLQTAFYYAVMTFIPCSDSVRDFAGKYFFIRIWAAPATLWLMAFKGFYIGMQHTVASMIVDLTVNLVNILASLLLTFFTPLGVVGVAYGTVIAQYTGVIVAFIILFVRYPYVISAVDFRRALTPYKLKTLFIFNSNLFIRSLCFMVVYVGFTSLATRYGEVELALSSIVMKLFMLFSYFVDGFAYAGEALVGRFFGARDRMGAHATVRALAVWGVGITILFTIVFGIWGDTFILWMSDDPAIKTAAPSCLLWLCIMPSLSCFAFLWDGIYIGAADDKGVRNCMIWAALSFVLSYILAAPAWGMQALYMAYMIHLAVRGIYLTLRWRHISDF